MKNLAIIIISLLLSGKIQAQTRISGTIKTGKESRLPTAQAGSVSQVQLRYSVKNSTIKKAGIK